MENPKTNSDSLRNGRSAAITQNSKCQMNAEYETISNWLQNVKFRKKFVGGYDPEDVWKKLDELNTLYENALISERARYNMMLRQFMANRDSEEKDG